MATTVPLAANELKKIEIKSRRTRPFYYNASTDLEEEISEDMEAFLILLPAEVKAKMAKFIKEASEFQDLRSDRDSLLLEFLEDDLKDLESVYAEAIDASTDIGIVSDQFSPGKFGAVEDVSLFMSDISKGFPERLSTTSRIFFDIVQNRVVTDKMVLANYWRGFDSDEVRREFKSWLGPILAYL